MAARTHPKVKAAGGAGAAAVVLVWVLDQVGVSMPPEVAAAVTTLLATGAGYLKGGA